MLPVADMEASAPAAPKLAASDPLLSVFQPEMSGKAALSTGVLGFGVGGRRA